MSLREKIKTVMHSNVVLESILNYERKIQFYYVPHITFTHQKKQRIIGKAGDIYIERIKKYKNIHKEDRCFIVCTGPSLTNNDLNLIRNEFSFGMNSIVLQDNWHPTYYGIQDIHVYEKMKEQIHNYTKEIPTFMTKDIFISGRDDFANRENIIVMPVYGSDHLVNPESDRFEFSEDCYIQIHDGYSITISLIQLAYYMGFREIYLLGADTNYDKNGSQHFIDFEVDDKYIFKSKDRNIRMYEKVKSFADQNGLKIYNATRGGMLEVFPRVNLDEMELK